MPGSRAGLQVCRPGGDLRPAPGAECESRLRGSPPLEGWEGAETAPLTLRLCPVVSRHSSVPDLEPVRGAWWPGPDSHGSGLESRGLGPQEQRRGERPGRGEASAGASGSQSSRDAAPRTRPQTRGLVPDQRSERQLTKGLPVLGRSPVHSPCSRPSSVPGPKA